MERIVIATDKAPAAIGPYSQAIVVGDMVYTAGQAGLNPATKKLAEGIEAQTKQTMQNLTAILEAAGSSMDMVVKTTVFLQDMGDFAAMNGVYAQFFGGEPPARSTVQAAALPLSALVEIEAVAVVK